MRRRATLIRAFIIAGVAASLSGCTLFGGRDDSPPWFRQRVSELEKGKYPQLGLVPATTPSNKSPADWQRTEAEVQNAGAALEANPRAAGAAPETTAAAGAFEAEARKQAAPARPER